MTDQTEQALTESVTEIIGWVEQAKDFAVEQAPDVVQQLLAWELVTNLAGTVALLLGAAVVAWSSRACWRKHHALIKDGGYDREDWDAGAAITGAAAAGLFLASWVPALSAIKVFVAPKLVVLAALKGLL